MGERTGSRNTNNTSYLCLVEMIAGQLEATPDDELSVIQAVALFAKARRQGKSLVAMTGLPRLPRGVGKGSVQESKSEDKGTSND